MRRCTASAALAVAASASRGVFSVVVSKNVPPATKTNKLGVPATRAEAAAAYRVPLNLLDKTVNPRIVRFTQMELARTTHAPLIATAKSTDRYTHVEREVEEAFAKDDEEKKKNPVVGALRRFKETEWRSIAELVRFYEEVMYPIRAAQRCFAQHELTRFHIKDVLKRGLSAFKQDFLDEQKTAEKKVKAEMQYYADRVSVCVKEGFDTALCNDLANILRIAGEQHEQAHAMCLKVLEDMNRMGVAYDDITREIMKATVFNDGPFDDSQLLFEVIEYPERGEISVGTQPLKEVSETILKLISNRHQTPLDADCALLYSTETHPNLQRSPE